MTPDTYYDAIFCINLDRRTDRWAQCVEEFAKYGITKYERWPGSLGFSDDGTPHGNKGCTLSHRRLLRHIAENFAPEAKILVLEDDFKVHVHHLGGAVSREVFEREFAKVMAAVPTDWDMVYIGGHWACAPMARINANCLRVQRMLTTSSYSVTGAFAKTLSDRIETDARAIDPKDPFSTYLGPIDSLYSNYLPEYKVYCLQPRLMIQREGLSDLTEKRENYLFAMTSETHENMV